ncbi:MAG TPA: ankyrin repeat domain-containing protein [Thermoanaerobaculia bacterium]|nr:ankyrin repeat domain-containing protein [Thermoanaerobaculia bacterium]
MKIRILASIALALAVLAAGAFWTLTTLLPRARPESPLEKAASAGFLEELRREVRLRGGLNATDGHGFTPLDWAARTGRTDVIRELVREGADPDLRDEGPNGWAPLHHAVHKGRLEAVRALIAAGAQVDAGASRSHGITPLMLACAQGEPRIVDALLAAGADPHVTQPGGETTLTYAMTTGNRRVTLALLHKAPDLRLAHSWKGVVARLLARMRGQSDILAQLNRPSKRAEAAR